METSITPVVPLMSTSAMKMTPAAFGWVRAAIVVFKTSNEIEAMPVFPLHVGQFIPESKVPKSGWPFTSNVPVTPTVVAGDSLTILAAPPDPLNANIADIVGFIAPVSAKKVKLGPDTVTLTLAPFWVSVTVPNGAVPQPFVQWSDVRLKMAA